MPCDAVSCFRFQFGALHEFPRARVEADTAHQGRVPAFCGAADLSAVVCWCVRVRVFCFASFVIFKIHAAQFLASHTGSHTLGARIFIDLPLLKHMQHAFIHSFYHQLHFFVSDALLQHKQFGCSFHHIGLMDVCERTWQINDIVACEFIPAAIQSLYVICRVHSHTSQLI